MDRAAGVSIPRSLGSAANVQVLTEHVPKGGWRHMPEVVTRKMTFSLVFVFDRATGQILLGKKQRGLGLGLWNGFGGKMNPGETMHDCAVRELQEESGLKADLEHFHDLGNFYINRPEEVEGGPIKISLYLCEKWEGEPTETEEMMPEWHDPDNLPYELMWAEASVYFPIIVDIVRSNSPRKLFGRVEYDFLPPTAAVKPNPPGEGIEAHSTSDGLEEVLCGWWFGVE